MIPSVLVSTRRAKLLHVVGARPNFMKVAPIMAAVERWNQNHAADAEALAFSQTLVHTGQHYDDAMSAVFFRDLGLPAPDVDLGVGSGSHAQQTAEVLRRLEPVLLAEGPDLVIVVGDVNSTLAAALCAAKLRVPVAHVEAGLRSGDRAMPEELNRLITDQLADLLFTTSTDADENLAREGIPQRRIHFVGNTMIDTLERLTARAQAGDAVRHFGLSAGGYALVTLHRPSNVDDGEQLTRVVRLVSELAKRIPVVFPVHRRTRERLEKSAESAVLEAQDSVLMTEPLGYLDFVGLMSEARLVLTDSGGVQEETTVLGVPCLTLRTTTERPVTLTEGTNRLIDPLNSSAMQSAVEDVLRAPFPTTRHRPELWMDMPQIELWQKWQPGREACPDQSAGRPLAG